MSYVERQLSGGERVVFSTTLHPIILVVPVIVSALGLATVVGLFVNGLRGWGLALLALTAIIASATWIRFTSAEFAVTDRRVIIKVGFVSRRTVETLLTKVEGIQVEQGIAGRILNYGTIRVIGTGGTREEFELIAKPLAFRQKVQEGASTGHLLGAHEHLAGAPATVGGGSGGQPATDRIAQLERLVKLRDQGALTAEEFEREKRKVMG